MLDQTEHQVLMFPLIRLLANVFIVGQDLLRKKIPPSKKKDVSIS